MIPPKDKHLLCQLILKFKDQTITPQELEFLDKTFQQHPESLELLTQIIEVHTQLNRSGDNDLIREDSEILSDKLWQVLANEEKTAQVVPCQTPAVVSDSDPDMKIKPLKIQRTRKSSLITFAASLAALILVVIFARYLPAPSGIEVATLTDSMKARWDVSSGSKENGSRLVTGYTPLSLREGIIELLFNNNAKVVIEAPAEFCLLTEDQIKLNYGRLYAVIPSEALGFTVTTPNSKIIDLGTEFGVEVSSNSTTEMHVLKGSTTLISGEKENKTGLLIAEGQAKRISGLTATISDVRCNYRKFARNINHRSQSVWRGENISLASIAAGHDGFQEIDSLIGLNPVNGTYTASVIQKNRNSNGRYNPVADSDFIDGVFVPDGESGPIQVTSLGHTFDCPDTSGIFTHEIAAYKGPIENQHTTIPPVIINGQEVVNESILMLHSNTGITFDLQAIRNSLPRLDLKNFKATGVPMKEFNPDIYFWVLVDGQIKYEKKIVTVERDPISLNIELGPQDRFLTLIVTDGLQATGEVRKDACSSDFFYLIKPQLCLTDNLNK